LDTDHLTLTAHSVAQPVVDRPRPKQSLHQYSAVAYHRRDALAIADAPPDGVLHTGQPEHPSPFPLQRRDIVSHFLLLLSRAPRLRALATDTARGGRGGEEDGAKWNGAAANEKTWKWVPPFALFSPEDVPNGPTREGWRQLDAFEAA
jgi:hypothetical protein